MTLVATQVKRRRGTNDENDAFAGAEGEITVDLTNKELRVHDGSGKTGGFRIGRRTDRTNCITEIPQDIKYELNNGVLTIKAGSKFYMPDGNGVFTEKILDQDRTYSLSLNGQRMLFANQYLSGLDGYEVSHIFSGATAPSGYTYMFWYDTANNVIKSTQDGGVTWGNKYTFPLFVVTLQSGTGVVSVDRVFNGIGYVGGTVFALPGVKALAPNGRNTDGTLKNLQINITSVQTLTQGGTYDRHLFLTNINTISATVNDFTYDEPTNVLRVLTDQARYCYCGEVGMTNGQITSFETNTVFHAVDYNDSDYIANCAMPSDKYIDLTLGASGTTYTAPANGYLYFQKRALAVGEFIRINNNITQMGSVSFCTGSSGTLRIFMPVKKSDVNTVAYGATGITDYFRFIYAEGSK